MKKLATLALGAAMLGGVALAAAPASAGVVVGIGLGGGHHHARGWCWHHPGACHGGGIVVAGPRIGVYYGGRGWWDGHRYWRHRYRWHAGWRYR